LSGKYVVTGLPPRGTGLATGRAEQGARRLGVPRSDWERWLRHFGIETPNPWDWESFGWGLLGGALATAAIGGTVLYFTWPYIVATLRTIPVFKEMVAEAKAKGLI